MPLLLEIVTNNNEKLTAIVSLVFSASALLLSILSFLKTSKMHKKTSTLEALKLVDESWSILYRFEAVPNEHVYNIHKVEIDKAFALAERATILDPKNVRPFKIRAQCMIMQGKIDEAITFITTGKKFEREHGYHCVLARAYYTKKQLVKAEIHANKANKLKPNCRSIFFTMSDIKMDQKKVDEAIDVLKKGFLVYPEDGTFCSWIGARSINNGKNYDDAILFLRKAISLGNRNAINYYNLAIAHYYQNNAEDSIICFNKALELDPSYWKAYGNLGATQLKLTKEYAKAEQNFKKAIALYPEDAVLYKNLAESLMFQNKTEEAARAEELHKTMISSCGVTAV